MHKVCVHLINHTTNIVLDLETDHGAIIIIGKTYNTSFTDKIIILIIDNALFYICVTTLFTKTTRTVLGDWLYTEIHLDKVIVYCRTRKITNYWYLY